MLYLFYTVLYAGPALSVRSDAAQLTVGGGETYSAEHYTGQCRLMPSYYYSSYLQDVSVGTPLAVVETFRIPAEVLTSGQAITLTNAQIPEMDQLILSTEDLVLCQGVEEVAQAADPTGYDRIQALRAEADPETAEQVRQAVNGRAWNCYIDGISYQIAFFPAQRLHPHRPGGSRHRDIHSGTGVHRLPGPQPRPGGGNSLPVGGGWEHRPGSPLRL